MQSPEARENNYSRQLHRIRQNQTQQERQPVITVKKRCDPGHISPQARYAVAVRHTRTPERAIPMFMDIRSKYWEPVVLFIVLIIQSVVVQEFGTSATLSTKIETLYDVRVAS